MTGSILGHAYYTLERKGVSVITDTSARTRVRQRQVFRKLVRDEIPTKIAEHGERANLARIAKHESRTALVVKLFEEAHELLSAVSPAEVSAELADLLEVVRSLAAATGVEWSDVQKVAEEKREARGSFERNVVLIETSWPKWADATGANPATDIIPLKDLGEIVDHDGMVRLNFASVIAKGANNIVDVGNGVRIAISMVGGGIQIERLDSTREKDSQQMEFNFAAASRVTP